MSLSTFHLFFLCVATVVSVGFSGWSVAAWARTGSRVELWMAAAALAGSVALVRYAWWFRRHRRELRL